MSARGYGSAASEGRSIQAPGMMRHGPAPSLGPPLRHPIDVPPLPPPEILENNLAVQGAEMDKLLKENHKLAASHGLLRHELLAAQQEMQRVQTHASQVQVESNVQIKNLLDKISKFESEIIAGEAVKKELQQAHMEAQGLVATRMELSLQIQQAAEELQRVHSDIKKLPEMKAEMERLVQGHQKLRSTFEREKGANMELVQKMHAMEKNLISMAREVEKLRKEVEDAEKRAQAPVPNPYQSPYAAGDSSRNPSQDNSYGQGTYASGMYGQGAGYSTNGGYVQATSSNYADPYGRAAKVQMMGTTAGEKAYGAGVGEKVNPYGSTVATSNYNAAQGAATLSGYDSAMGAVASYATGFYDAARASAGGGGGVTGGGVTGGGYDPSRSAVGLANVYEASTRSGEGVGGTYNTSVGAANVYGSYEAARAAQMPTQR